jgi:hypothetical protein
MSVPARQPAFCIFRPRHEWDRTGPERDRTGIQLASNRIEPAINWPELDANRPPGPAPDWPELAMIGNHWR